MLSDIQKGEVENESIKLDKLNKTVFLTGQTQTGEITSAEISDALLTVDSLDPNIFTLIYPNGDQAQVSIGQGKIRSFHLSDGSVTTVKILDKAVTTAKLADGSVTEIKILDGAVTSGKIADGTILAQDLSSGSVIEAKIADGAVTSSKLADDSVISSKIADGSVTESKLSDSSVTNSKISDLSITATKIATGTITGTQIASDGTVVKSLIAGSEITVTNNTDGTWTISDSSGGEGDVVIAPTQAQTDTTTRSTLRLNKTGSSGNLLELEVSNTDKFVINYSGIVTTGVWQGTAIASGYITSTLTGKTYNGLNLTSQIDGFTISGGTTSRTLTITGSNVSINQSLQTSDSPTFNTLNATTITDGTTSISGGTVSATTITDGTATLSDGDLSGTGTVTATTLTDGTTSITAGTITGATYNGLAITTSGNTFNLSRGTGSLDVASGVTVDINSNLIVNTSSVTLNQSLQTSDSPSFSGLTIGTLNGILKATTGVVSAAIADTDYQQPITWGDGLSYSAPTASVDYNATNLQITSEKINTIQDITTNSTPTFNALTLSTNQGVTGLTTASSPTFVGLTLTGFSGALQASGGTISASTLPVSLGGIGQTSFTDGQLLIGNSTGNTLTKANLTEGEGINITNGSGSIQIDGEDATTTNKGIASFNDSYFTVASGAVSIDDIYLRNNADDTTSGTITMANLKLQDTSSDHQLQLTYNEDATATRTLNVTLNDANRAFALQGDLTVESASTLNQDLTTDAAPTFSSATLNNIHLIDSGTAFNLIIASDSTTSFTADRTLTLDLDNVSRVFTLQGNLTVESVSTLNQDLTTDASVTFTGLSNSDANITSVGNIALDSISGAANAIAIGDGADTITLNPTAGTSFSDKNITNVGDIDLDSISPAATDIDILLSDPSATALEITDGTTTYLTFDSTDTQEKIEVGATLDLSNNIDMTYNNGGTALITNGVIQAAAVEDKFLRNDGDDTTTGTITMTNLKLQDTSSDHQLQVSYNEDATATRTLNVTLNDANRALALQGNLTVESVSVVNQDLSSDASPTFASPTVNNLHVIDSGTAFDLILESDSTAAFTADRTLTVDIDNSSRSFTLQGNLTVESTSTLNQDLTTDASVVFTGLSNTDANITNVGDIALDSLSADASSITLSSTTDLADGVDLTYNSGASTVIDNGVVQAAAVQDKFLRNDGDDVTSGSLTLQGGSITLGTTAQTGSIEIYDGSDHKITLTSPSISADYTLTLPTDDGASGEFLQTDGSGNLSWASGSGAWEIIDTYTATGTCQVPIF